MTVMTTGEARQQLIESLTPRYGAGEASAIARIVLEDAFGLRNNAGTRVLDDSERTYFGRILERLLSGEPVQYVIGEAAFFGLRFSVGPAVLIPRQETEELVAWALEYLKQCPVETPDVLDIGLGSGCIGITLKKKMPRIRLSGVETCPEALSVAIQNAEKILGAGQFVFSLCNILQRSNWAQFSQFDLLISNPPYIPESEMNKVPWHVSAFEPEIALFVKEDDPLIFYRVIAAFSLEKLRPGGALFFECNEFNAVKVAELMQEFDFADVELRKDIAGADRMLRALKPL